MRRAPLCLVILIGIAACGSSSPGTSKRDAPAATPDSTAADGDAGPVDATGGDTGPAGDVGVADWPGDSTSPDGNGAVADGSDAADRASPPPDAAADLGTPIDAPPDQAPDAPPPDMAPDTTVDAPPPLPVGTCFPAVAGVPGSVGAPAWWSGGAPLGSATTRWIDDPRWRGAASYGSLGDYARFRAVVETVGQAKFLVLSWFIKVDISGPFDRLYVGFFDEAAGEGNVFRLTRQYDQATAVAGVSYFDSAFSGRVFYWKGAGWVAKPGAPPPLPDWLKNDTRLDVFCTGPGCQAWAIRMRIPIDPAALVDADNQTGVKLTSTRFRFWYDLQESIGGTLTPAYAWPTGLTSATESGGAPPIQFPDPAGWNLVDVGTTCAGEIALDPGQVYVNTPGNTQVSLTSPNTFHARPRNTTGAPLNNATIKATFRLAGVNAGGASPTWEALCTDVFGAAATVPPGGQLDLTCGPWSVPDSCAYRPAGDPCGATAGTRSPQQAILVDLAVASSGDSARLIAPQSDAQPVQF